MLATDGSNLNALPELTKQHAKKDNKSSLHFLTLSVERTKDSGGWGGGRELANGNSVWQHLSSMDVGGEPCD